MCASQKRVWEKDGGWGAKEKVETDVEEEEGARVQVAGPMTMSTTKHKRKEGRSNAGSKRITRSAHSGQDEDWSQQMSFPVPPVFTSVLRRPQPLQSSNVV